VALYTGNDDNIVADLITPYRFKVDGRQVERRFVGGLLGHWAVWTHRAVELLQRCLHAVRDNDSAAINQLLHTNIEVTDMNAAIFDPAHQYTGCIPGIHHVLCQQGLLQHEICLDPGEKLSPGQAGEIDRIRTAYPHLTDDQFITQNISNWLTE